MPAEGDGQVAAAGAGAPAAGEEAQGQQQQSGWAMFKGFATRMVIMYMVMSFFRGNSSNNQTQTTAVGPNGEQITVPVKQGANIFPKGTSMSIFIYLNDLEFLPEGYLNQEAPHWSLEEIEYGDWYGGPNKDSTYFTHFKYVVPESVQNNGTIYLHCFLTKDGSGHNPLVAPYNAKNVIYRSKAITKFKKREFKRTKNLLTGETETLPELRLAENETDRVEISSHFHPNFTINVVDDHTPWKQGQVPSPLDKFILFDESGDYYPIVFFNDYWNLNSDFMPLNDTVKEIDFQLSFAPLSLFKWQMYAAQTMRNHWAMFLMEDQNNDADQDTFKRALLDTNPYLLGLTIVVSIVHSVFEFLAFKNDIQFWRTRESLEGLSVRSVFFNVFTSLIVVLYVLDNETNTVVQISCAIGLLIELWKITKVVHVSVSTENMTFGFIPLKFEERSSYRESPTKYYDRMAFKYLGVLFIPLLVGYSVYSLVYNEHKGWYSYVLGMMYGFLLTFGFIMMTPQLFINYKMKSVAHLPWRMLTYKALNTFIDDIFAFVIQMPTLYRIGCLRDDVIFFIYLYQKWIYPVDKTRANEYGITGEQLEQADAGTKQGGSQLQTPPSDGPEEHGMQNEDNQATPQGGTDGDSEGKKDK